MNLEELEDILQWKLRGQYGRQQKKREINNDLNVITITKAAFAISHLDKDIETTLRLKILSTLIVIAVCVTVFLLIGRIL